MKRFFWLLFFAQAKKSDPRQRKLLLLLLLLLQSLNASMPQCQNQDNGNRKGKSFRLAASHFSLLAQRKVTKRKRALPRALRAARSGSADAPGIRGRGILPLPRTAHIHVRRPFGVFPRSIRRCGREPGKSKATATAIAKATATATATAKAEAKTAAAKVPARTAAD
ncbi:hypothetical protein HDC36_003860 [Xanthomonas sp. JAI131]|uniref:hypothetical protein n=1 Tax=Xanthomonas sp. JAI131 TaxID=2723067 RepID=UPI0015CDC282|nr:hypothetical protein [Xanthomonas sp. JAI131]NYF22384.1 hypothetical protein [Xanthomonas sp. JAI131]